MAFSLIEKSKLSRSLGCSSSNMCHIYQENMEFELHGVGYIVKVVTLSSPSTQKVMIIRK